jgi:hypothetical protein
VSIRKTATTLLAACAAGVALSLVLAGAGRASKRPPEWPSARVAATPAVDVAPPALPAPVSLEASASTPTRARPARSPSPLAKAVADEALCRRAAAVGPDGSGAATSSPADDATILAAERRIVAALLASPDPFSQAVAAWLEPIDASSELRQRQERLSRQAATTSDARVYALAYRECMKGDEDDSAPGCRALSARQWAQIDRGNALPWVYVLGEATVHGDVAARDDALYQIASSSRFEERSFAPAQAILEHAGTDGAELVAANALVSQAFGLTSTQTMPIYALLSACHNGADEDANGTPRCADTVELLMRHSDTMALRRIGGAMDFTMTGDTTRRDRLRDESKRLGTVPSPRETGGCGSLREAQDFQRRAGEIGEVAALREHASY